MLWKVGFLSENEVVVKGEELSEVGINGSNVGGGNGDVGWCGGGVG